MKKIDRDYYIGIAGFVIGFVVWVVYRVWSNMGY